MLRAPYIYHVPNTRVKQAGVNVNAGSARAFRAPSCPPSSFGMESIIRQIGIYASQGQLYRPHDVDMLLYYREEKNGQILEEGITEAGSMASMTAAGTAYSNYGVPTIPFFTYYSMFGFQRVGDMIWAFADARGRGFLVGGTAGRTTLAAAFTIIPPGITGRGPLRGLRVVGRRDRRAAEADAGAARRDE